MIKNNEGTKFVSVKDWKKTTVWMPVKEAIAWKKLMKKKEKDFLGDVWVNSIKHI